MKTTLRQETAADHSKVFGVIKSAFANVEISDQSEPYLVERLRKSEAFIPALSIVAEVDQQIVGHIILSKIKIQNSKNAFDSLALAPVSVLPDFQNKGIGSQLILKSHEVAKSLGYQSIVLIGHENYYPKFGYEWTSKYQIELPFKVPETNAMVISLTENGLKGVTGLVVYPPAFFS